MCYQQLHTGADCSNGRYKGILLGCLCIFLCLLVCVSATDKTVAFADEKNVYGSIKAECRCEETYTLTVKNIGNGVKHQTAFDGELEEQLPAGEYTVSCEEKDGRMLVFKNNTFTVTPDETTVLEVKEGDAAKLYVRPTLFENFGGTIFLTLKSADSFGQEYSFTVPRYSYDYSGWSDNFYWADFLLPEGTYEITCYQVSNNGMYYRTYVQEKQIKAVGSWSGILYSTTSEQTISVEEADAVYLMDELQQETEAAETGAAEETDSTENKEKGVSVITFFLLLFCALVLTAAIFLLARKVVIGSGRKK